MAVHLAFTLVWGAVAAGERCDWRMDVDSVIIASNVLVGGSATAATMASTIGRDDLIVPANLCGILGYVVGTPIGRAAVSITRALRPV